MLEYLVAFAVILGINVVPFLMPPSWLVLAFFYNNYAFSAILLALIGAAASTSGRFLLTYIGSFSRRFAGKKRKDELDFIGKEARQNPVKSFFITLLVALSPFPSNVYFLGVGLSKARVYPVFAAFFTGRLISYYILIVTSKILFSRIDEIFTGRLTQIIVIDAIGIVFMLLFLVVDWKALIEKKKLRFVPIRLKKP